MRRSMTLAVGALALALVAPGVATATAPQPVSFNGTFTENSDVGTFYGAPAPLCPSGTTKDVAGLAAGFQSGSGIQLLVAKEFDCATTDDTFTLLLQVHIEFAPEYTNRFTWTVLDGTGAFARLHGRGTGSAVPTSTGGIDTYVGTIHLD
jgi:hypothetical protein